MQRPRIRKVYLWIAAGLSAGIVVLGLQAFWIEPSSLTVVNERLALPGLRSTPLKIAVLADLHVGSPFNGIDNLKRVVALTNEQQPDIVCILGDLVIQGVRGGRFVPPEDIASEVAGLRSKLGSFAVLGNHDDWLDHDRVANALTRNGITVIEETARRLETAAGPVWLAGVSDYWMGRHDVSLALQKVTDPSPIILLSHNPDIFPYVSPRVALTLAGHTHGGQVRFPLFGALIVPSEHGQRYAAGHIIENGRHMYVATGVGTSILPVRFRVPPSITMLTLSQM